MIRQWSLLKHLAYSVEKTLWALLHVHPLVISDHLMLAIELLNHMDRLFYGKSVVFLLRSQDDDRK